jgi:SNF2 family DNA or RNA helicase
VKYYELRNDRVLVLAPKRLRDNWTLYRSNDRRNVLATDRFNFDVLNHTDLSRDSGRSGDIDGLQWAVELECRLRQFAVQQVEVTAVIFDVVY